VQTQSPPPPSSDAVQALLKNFLGSLGVQPESDFIGTDAGKLAALQLRCVQQHTELWQSMLARESGQESAAVAPPDQIGRAHV
jgi:hypothetical protein